MQNILVTGGSGFIGSNFIRYLFTETDFSGRVVNLDALTYAANPESLCDIAEQVGSRYVFCKADVCDAVLVKQVFDTYEIDTVCHFAAESHVDRSIVGPGAFIQTNIVGTYTLLEVCRSLGSEFNLFHHVSTDEVFGSLGESGLFTEQTPYQPNSPYSASKASSDHIVRAYGKTYGLPMTISNCSNNYGQFQFPEKLIPLMILNAKDGKALPVYGDGRNVRDWLFVRDHCRAIWEVMLHGKRGQTYNVGGNNEMENIRVVELIADLVDEYAGRLCTSACRGSRRDLITFVKDRPGHDRRYAIDSSKIERELEWRPEETFETGLQKTVRWYLDNPVWVSRVQTGEYRKWIDTHYTDTRNTDTCDAGKY